MRNQLRQVVCDGCKFLTLKKSGDEPCYFCGAVAAFHEMPHSWDRSSCPQCGSKIVGDRHCVSCSKECRVSQMTKQQAPERPSNALKGKGGSEVKEAFAEPVGDALAALIPDWAVADRRGCDCKSWQLKMNRWGADGCEAREHSIVQHLVKQSQYLKGVLSYLPRATYEYAAKHILRRAIKNARKK